MSCVWTAWITEPDPKNRQPLKQAWVTMWKSPADTPPTPIPAIMNPSCDTVLYARTFLMSFAQMPIVAAKIAVNDPTSETTRRASGLRNGNERPTK